MLDLEDAAAGLFIDAFDAKLARFRRPAGFDTEPGPVVLDGLAGRTFVFCPEGTVVELLKAANLGEIGCEGTPNSDSASARATRGKYCSEGSRL